jgi:hypothetical protein
MLDDNDVVAIALREPVNRDLYDELSDEQFQTRTHGKKATSAQGCRGPLCRWAERTAKQEETRLRVEAQGRIYTPRKTAARERDEFLAKVYIWHCQARELAALIAATSG